MTDDKTPKFKPRKKKVRFRNCSAIKGVKHAQKVVKQLMKIAKEYDCFWMPEDNVIRYNTIYGNKMRFNFKRRVLRVECHKDERWRRVASYGILRIDFDQWRAALDYIAATYA